MKTLILGLLIPITLFSSASYSAEEAVQPTFCGFFLDKKPLTVEIKSDKSAVLTYQGKVTALTVTSFRVDGIPHGYECDDSTLCVTGMEFIVEGQGERFEIYDSWRGQSATMNGKTQSIQNFHTLNGVCE